MSLDLISKFRELEQVGIIKNFRVGNGEFRFEFGVPKENVLEILDKYLYEKYGLVFP